MAYSSVIEKKAFCLMLAIFVISICCTGIVHSSPERPEPLADPKIVIMGATGVGKSSLANVLLGEGPDCTNCTFPWCDGSESCTNHTKYAEGKWLGLEAPFTVVDTPGFGDSEGRDDELIDEMVDVFTHHINTTNVFLITFNGEDPRMDAAINQMIREMEMLFGYKFWDNVLLEATHWAYTESKENERNYTGKDEEWWTEDKNTVLRNKFHLDHNLTAVFIDAYAKQPYNLGDKHQQEMFAREASKLWDFAMNHPPFAFRTIEDVLEDLDTCTRTLEGDIAELKAEMLEVRQNFTEVEMSLDKETLERQENDSALQNNVTARLDQETLERQENDSALQKNVTEQLQQEITERKMNEDAIIGALEQETNDRIANYDEVSAEIAGNVTALNKNITEVQDDVDHIQTSPLGSIIAWVTKPEEAAENETLTIPDGWVPCDGKPIPEPSKWAGWHTPDLNGEKRFLRGGDYTTQLVMEADTMQDHMHEENQHSHHATASASSQVTIHDHYYGWSNSVHDDANGCTFRQISSSKSSQSDTYYPSVSVTVTNNDATCGTKGVASEYRHGDETRPVNMNVQWIMKVW